MLEAKIGYGRRNNCCDGIQTYKIISGGFGRRCWPAVVCRAQAVCFVLQCGLPVSFLWGVICYDNYYVGSGKEDAHRVLASACHAPGTRRPTPNTVITIQATRYPPPNPQLAYIVMAISDYCNGLHCNGNPTPADVQARLDRGGTKSYVLGHELPK